MNLNSVLGPLFLPIFYLGAFAILAAPILAFLSVNGVFTRRDADQEGLGHLCNWLGSLGAVMGGLVWLVALATFLTFSEGGFFFVLLFWIPLLGVITSINGLLLIIGGISTGKPRKEASGTSQTKPVTGTNDVAIPAANRDLPAWTPRPWLWAIVFLLAIMAVAVAAVHKRLIPDRRLDYSFEIVTNDGRTLNFKGSTKCTHIVTPGGLSHYSTENYNVATKHQEEDWILSRIDCDQAIKEKKPGHYVLYRKLDAELAKVYLVDTKGSARLISWSFDSTSLFFSSKVPSVVQPSSFGPFVYQKVFLRTAPSAVRDAANPVVVYGGSNTCGILDRSAVSVPPAQFPKSFEGGEIAVEEGVLEYRRSLNAWVPKPHAGLAEPMDAVMRASGSNAADQLPPECLRLIVDGRAVLVSGSPLGAMLYVPAEKALYRIGTFSYYYLVSGRSRRSEDWALCAPPGPDDYEHREGLIYLRSSKIGFVTRKNGDGTFSCARNFAFLR